MSKQVVAGLAAAWLVGAAGAAGAQPAADSDWPCVQRLVPSLAAGQMWQGPALTAASTEDPLSPPMLPLRAALVDRGVPLDGARAEVAAALKSVPADQRGREVTRLFVGVLDDLNAERAGTIAGIKRFARAQRGIAERITRENARIEELSGDPAADAEVAELRQAQAWSRRVYDDRQRSLRSLCDQPVLMEQRAFAVARGLTGLVP